ncbi:MAG: restriction endonuclease subunit S [Methanosarcinaceae archaeon]|nr:restriction endonuclease subunit S [Methanosarcinaceae archaeon]
MSWHDITLGDAIHVKHGFAFKGQHFSDNGEYIVLTPGNFNEEGGFKLRPGKDRFYTGDIPEDYILEEGDLIIAMTEQGPGLLGSSALISDSDKFLHNQRLGLIQDIDETVLDKKYLYYLFNTRSVRGQIRGSATGTKVKHTAPERIYRIEATVPSEVTEQKKIASILSAYDDLIENNRRRIQLLEQAARLLYKEWFVHLRFPGHEHVTITDGVPEGWEKKPLFDIASPTYGFAFKSKLFNTDNEGLPIARIRDIPSGKSQTYTIEEAPKEKLLEDGDFVIGMDGDFHMNFWTGGKTWINQRVVRIKGTGDVSDAFLRYACEKPIQDFNATIVGTTVAHLGAKHLKIIEILIPPIGILYDAQDFFDSTQFQIVVLSNQNRLAKNARDLLLPRLMNGEVAV